MYKVHLLQVNVKSIIQSLNTYIPHYTDTVQYDDDNGDDDDSSIQAAISLFDEGELHNSATWLQFSLLCVFFLTIGFQY